MLLAPLALAASRCTSPEPALYTLRPVLGTPQGGGPIAVKLEQPGLAGYLDRTEIVRDAAANRLDLASGERWGEPLGDMIGRVLGLDLSQRLPGSSVFTAAGTLSVDATATVELDVQRFDLDTDGTVVLLAQVAVEQGSRDPAFTRSLRLTSRPASAATADLVSAMSAVLGQLADALAALLRASNARAAGPMPLQTRHRR